MQVVRKSLASGAKEARGLVVIIDVFRAFSCGPLFLDFHAKKVILEPDPTQAIELTKKALDHLVNIGFDPQFGARPLKRAIQKYLLNPLSVKLLEGNITGENILVKVDYDGKDFVFK